MKIDKPPKLGDAWPTSDNVLGIGISGIAAYGSLAT